MRKIALVTILVAANASANDRMSVRGSKHDLSVSGPGPIRATLEKDPCVFCHTMHGGSGKLLGRPDPGDVHRPYESGTMRSRPNRPTGSSRICLSCHDGTIAVGQTLKRRIEVTGGTSDGRIPASRRSNLGTDLRQSHPVSILPDRSPWTRPPPPGPVRLDEGGSIQCTSCHDPHSEYGGSREGMFLVEETHNAGLCKSCHVATMSTSHLASAKPFPPQAEGETAYVTVADSGCMGCHRSHGANPKGQLVRMSATENEDSMCLRCHGPAGPGADIAREMTKPSTHAIKFGGSHDAAEGPDSLAHRLPEASVGASRHATCVDCHDPHQANGRAGTPQRMPGSLDGVWGMDEQGNKAAPADQEYQICLKCHGDSANKPQATQTPSAFEPQRRTRDVNLRLVFGPSAASSHPVIVPGHNTDVPSLVPTLSKSSLIRCSDCHSSDAGPGAGGTAPRGPHGSIYPMLLERNYAMNDPSSESPSAYALCYKCHQRDVVLSETGSAFTWHRKHVMEWGAPCSACHNAHGVSSLAGTPLNNAHLVDFDVRVVQPVAGRRIYTSDGPRSGSCTLTCHGWTHDPAVYSPASSPLDWRRRPRPLARHRSP